MREPLFVKLSAVERKHKQFQGTLQSVRTSRKTARLASQASQIVTQLCVIAFNRIGIGFAQRDFIPAIVIPKTGIGIEPITEIPLGFGSIINHELDSFLCALPDHYPAQKAARFSIHKRDYVNPVFLSPIKVNNSSISAFSTWSGTGAAGSFSACALAQFATLW